MKILVVYDSTWGNTERVAKAVGGAFGEEHRVAVVRAGAAGVTDLDGVELLVVGAPVQGGRPTKPVQEFINGIRRLPAGTKVAAFDTRMGMRWVGIFGFAAPRVASALQAKGGTLAAEPEGFIVMGREGPLKAGEVERAAAWGRSLAK